MKSGKFVLFIVICMAIACYPTADIPTPTPSSIPNARTTTTAIPEEAWPSVIGPEPSYRVATFYYPWYRTPEVDGYWDHWGETSFQPPLDISSDYYPLLGAYSVADPLVLAQHFAALRAAKVGVIISSWWGQMSREDQAVALLLDVAEHYDIKVAFHIEPYGGRTANKLVSDIKYLYNHYGDHPAFYRTTGSSRWSPDARSKGLFFAWAITVPDTDSPSVEASYWQDAMDAIHELPDGGLVIANATEGYWIDGGHFDGLYNYATLHLHESRGFSWALGLPPDAWYVPSVLPGFLARRIGYPAEDFVPREDGATYDEQWSAALDEGVEPALVTITSFNEWHEGTQIEPAAVGATNGRGGAYEDYGALSPEGYLTLTGQLASQFLAMDWPETTLLRIRLTTTSDWTDFNLVSGANWLRPDLISASAEAIDAGMYDGHFSLNQPIAQAEAGNTVELVFDALFSDWESGEPLVFEIDRGHLGATSVELSTYVEGEPVIVQTVEWDGIVANGPNSFTFQVPSEVLFTATP